MFYMFKKQKCFPLLFWTDKNRVIQKESQYFGRYLDTVRKKVRMNMCLIRNGYRDSAV